MDLAGEELQGPLEAAHEEIGLDEIVDLQDWLSHDLGRLLMSRLRGQAFYVKNKVLFEGDRVIEPLHTHRRVVLVSFGHAQGRRKQLPIDRKEDLTTGRVYPGTQNVGLAHSESEGLLAFCARISLAVS